MHGQSEYTPTKQNHLRGILKIGLHGWNPQYKRWAHDEAIVVDCTAGNGRSEDGEDGSPIIINRHFSQAGYPFRQLCCEQTPASFARLNQVGINADLRIGKYQENVLDWLDGLSMKRPALGFVYCDPNGAKDLLDGYSMFLELSGHPLYNRLDFLFHWSMTAYQRSFGADIAWANDSLIDIILRLRTLKRYAIIREPAERHRWVIMYLLNTDKVDGRWRKQGFLSADEWMDKHLRSRGQRPLFDDSDYASSVGVPA